MVVHVGRPLISEGLGWDVETRLAHSADDIVAEVVQSFPRVATEPAPQLASNDQDSPFDLAAAQTHRLIGERGPVEGDELVLTAVDQVLDLADLSTHQLDAGCWGP